MKDTPLDKTVGEFKQSFDAVKEKDKLVALLQSKSMEEVEDKLASIAENIEKRLEVYNESINSLTREMNNLSKRMAVLEVKVRTATATAAKLLAFIGGVLTLINALLKFLG